MNNIHPTAIIGENVVLGKNNKILAYTIIEGPTVIGDDNTIGPHVVIGSPGQDTRNRYYDSSKCKVEIGSRNIIREFCAIQKPCYKDITKIGDDVFLMQSVHIPHDCVVENKVVITPMCVLAGITTIQEGANLGMGVTVNQRVIVGGYSIVATGAATMKNLKPFSRYIPSKDISVNEYAIEKYGFGEFREEIYQYVINDVRPASFAVLEIIEKFEVKTKENNLKNY